MLKGIFSTDSKSACVRGGLTKRYKNKTVRITFKTQICRIPDFATHCTSRQWTRLGRFGGGITLQSSHRSKTGVGRGSALSEALAGLAPSGDQERSPIAKPGNRGQTKRARSKYFVVREEWSPLRRGLEVTTTLVGGDTKRK